MADWSKPTITSNYVTFVDEVKNRDIDAISLQANPITNPPPWAVKLLRSPVKFQQWTGAAFGDLVLSVEGGGTGANTPPLARSALGLGTMAVQNANTVAITGGTIANLTSSGSLSHTGATVYINAASPAPALYVGGLGAQYSQQIVGQLGLYIQAGITASDYNLVCVNRDLSRHALLVGGDMVVYLPWRLVIPVGANFWATA